MSFGNSGSFERRDLDTVFKRRGLWEFKAVRKTEFETVCEVEYEIVCEMEYETVREAEYEWKCASCLEDIG